MHPMLNIAIRAARMAGNLIAKRYENFDTIEVCKKYNNNFITNINTELEHVIVDMIRKFYSQHSIILNKSGEVEVENTNIQWIIDPLDGTTNFIKRFPHFAVSIAVRIKGYTEVAVVYDPMRNELFTASRGQGAQLNGYRLRVGTAHHLDGTILATAFHYKQKQHANIGYMTLVRKLLVKCADFRSTGSAVLDLAYVAAGRVDGLFEIGINPCDFASGERLVREAGGLVTDFAGRNYHLHSSDIVAGNPRIVKTILSTILD